MRKVLLPATAVALGALLFAGTAAQANPRATRVDSPTGDTYYVYANGGGGIPGDHTLQVWQESNGQAGECGDGSDVDSGLPVGHATEPGDEASGLQTTDGQCGSDTQVTPAL